MKGMAKALDKYVHKGERNHSHVDIRWFRSVPLCVLEQLVRDGRLDPKRGYNDSPAFGEFLEFMRRWPNRCMAHGYELARGLRDDHGVIIKGLSKFVPSDVPDKACDRAWKKLCKTADDASDTYCWWD